MKTSCIVLALLASTLAGAQAQVAGTGATATARQPALPAPTAFSPVSRDASSTVWERTVYERGTNGTVVPRKSRYTELSTGLNFLQNGQWRASRAEISLLPPGGAFAAAATQGSHKASFPLDIAQGVIQLTTPEGKQLQSRPVGLFYEDNKNSALIAILTNSVGELVGSNQVVYPDAFEGVAASVRYRYTRTGFEQDIVVQGQLPDPAALGLNPARTRLGVLTAFFDTNNPVATPGPVDSLDGLSDTTLTFGGKAGGMKMGRGRVFSIGNPEASPPPAGVTPASLLNWMTNAAQQSSFSKGNRSYKRWFKLQGRNFLMEEVPYRRVAAQLEQLPPATGRLNTVSTNLLAANSFLDAIPDRLLSPSASGEPAKTQTMRLSRVDWDQTQAVVLDYPLTLNSGHYGDYTFYGGTTYVISGPCYFGDVTIQGGTVIKYPNVNSLTPVQIGAYSWPGATAFIEVDGTLTCQTSSDQPAIFTAVDDITAGERTYGSTDNPSGNYYANPAIYAPGGVTLSNVRIRYAEQAVWVGDSSSITLSDSQVIDCGWMAVLGLGDGNSSPMTLTCNNCLYHGSGNGGVVVWDLGNDGDSYILNNCTIDNIYYMVYGPYAYYNNYGYAVNSIFANINGPGYSSWQGSYNGFYNSDFVSDNGYTSIFSSYPPFQTSGIDNYYLAAGCPFRNAGTTGIDPTLLADLQTLTTYAPQDGGYADNNGWWLDLGYHYPITADTVPDWWLMHWFGNLNHSGSDPDYQGNTLLHDYWFGLDPLPPFLISSQPLSQDVYVGDKVTFSVKTTGLTTGLTYQWTYGGTPILGATGSSYTISSAQTGDALNDYNYYYAVIVSLGAYSVKSADAVLQVHIIRDPFYRRIVGPRINYTFKSGVTYKIDSAVPLSENTTIEGGAILKFDYDQYDASLQVNGTLTCTGGPYNPAILTTIDDDSIGKKLGHGSQFDENVGPQPVGTGEPYIEMYGAQSSSISNLRFCYADEGVTTPAASRRLDVWDCQFVQCNCGVVNLVNGTGAVDSLHNVLFSGCGAAVEAWANNAINIEAEQVTADVDNFCLASTTPHRITLTNSIIWGSPVTAQIYAAIGVPPFSPNYSANFQSVNAGGYYLAADSTFHNSGTANISLRLRTEFTNKTTYAPVSIAPFAQISGQITLSPQARRYTGGAPDLGYYYDALDYTVAEMTLNGGTLRILPGTAIGCRFDYGYDAAYNWNDYTLAGFDVRQNSSVFSQGTPTKPNIFVDVQTVQEQFEWPVLATFMPDFYPAAAGDQPPTLNFRFSDFYLNYVGWFGCPASHFFSGFSCYNHLYIHYPPAEYELYSLDSAMFFTLQDCQVYGGQINLGNPNITTGNGYAATDYNNVWLDSDYVYGQGAVSWINNSFYHVGINLSPTYYDSNTQVVNIDMQVIARNNLFKDSPWFILVPNPSTAGHWVFKDNLFDKVQFHQDPALPLDFSYNGHWPLLASEVLHTSYFSFTDRLQPTATSDGTHEVLLTTAPPYQPGPYGNYYLPNGYPPNTPQALLHGAGSRTVADAGLYHYTTRLDQMKEGDDSSKGWPNINVNIGFHYVAADANGLPKDSDIGGSDGIPDYVENWHGDGDTGPNRTHKTDETDWKNPNTATDPTTGNPIPDAYNIIYDDVDLSGSGLDGRAKKALLISPFASSNPLTPTQLVITDPDSVSFTVPLDFDLLKDAGYLDLSANRYPVPFLRCDANPGSGCLLTWDITHEQSGLHLVQVGLTINGQSKRDGVGSLLIENISVAHPAYSFPLIPGTADWINASVADRLASVIIPQDWKDGSTSWQLYCSVVSSPYFRVIWVIGDSISQSYDAAKDYSVPPLHVIESQADFGVNNLRYLKTANINTLLNNDWNESGPSLANYNIVCYMAGLDSSLNTMDQASRQTLFRLAVWDANQFISTGNTIEAAGSVRLMYAVYTKPEEFRGTLSNVTLPILTSDEVSSLDIGHLPDELISAIENAKISLDLTSRP